MKVLLVRLDKIGDLVCTLPSDELPELKNEHVHWMISEGLEFIAQNAVPMRQFSTWNRKIDFFHFVSFLKFLSNNKFDLAITFQAPWWVNFGIWLMAVPRRAGVLSQWHSFLFLNQGLRQKRSASLLHEAEYNFAVVKKAFHESSLLRGSQKLLEDVSSSGSAGPVLHLRAPKKWPIPLSWGNYFVVHPGMAGSAQNWPQKYYIRTLEALLKQTSLTAVMTGTLADESHLAEIRAHFASHERFVNLQNLVKKSELLDVLDRAEFVLAPSTGILHLAASLHRPCFGIYSSTQVQHPRRWGPRGPSTQVFLPDEKSIRDTKTSKLEDLSPEDVIAAILNFLKAHK
jgi:ADP-heptose:LPS heptosyltransferase